MSNFDNQKIMHVKAGCLPPDDLLEFILSKKPNAFGFVVQNVADGKPDLSIIREDATGINLTELQQLFLNAKDFPLSVYFAKLAAGYNPADIQPFILKDGEDNSFMALMFEGTINGHDNPVNRTEQFNVVNGVIIPQITEWCEDFDGDLDKITAKLTGERFSKTVMETIGHRGILHIVPLEGDIINIGKNELGLDADWGWITQKDGYGDAVAKVDEPVVEKKRGFWKGGGAKATVASVPEVKQTEKGYPDKKDEAPALVARPPSWCHKNDDVKLWYNIVGNKPEGQLKAMIPANWKKRLPIMIQNFEAAKIGNLQDFTAYALKRTMQTTGATAETSAGEVVNSASPVLPKKNEKDITGVAGDVELPIIGPKDLEAVLEIVAKVDSNSKKIKDPKAMQAEETEYLLFNKAVGVTIEETMNWPVSGIFAIAKTDHRAAALMAIMYRNLYRNLKNGSVTIDKTDKSVTTTTVIGDTKKVESISTEAPIVPKKAGFWGTKKAA